LHLRHDSMPRARCVGWTVINIQLRRESLHEINRRPFTQSRSADKNDTEIQFQPASDSTANIAMVGEEG